MKLFCYCFRDFDEKVFFDQETKCWDDVSYSYTSEYPSPDNAILASGCDGISSVVTPFEAPLLHALHDVGVHSIISRSIGVDHIDLATSRALGMHVAHVAYPPEAVADYAIMLIMMCLRRMRPTMERAAIQDYTLNGKIGRDLCESTIGIVGAGKIGKTVARHLSGFGCRILAYDPYPDPSMTSILEYVSLPALLRESDVVTLHMPASKETYHIIDAHALSLMKHDAILINTARGTLIDTEALIASLESGHLESVGLDVIENEAGLYYMNRVGDCIPHPQLARLRTMPNVILTPHTAFYTCRTVAAMAEQTVQCMRDLELNRPNPLILF